MSRRQQNRRNDSRARNGGDRDRNQAGTLTPRGRRGWGGDPGSSSVRSPPGGGTLSLTADTSPVSVCPPERLSVQC